LGDELIQRRRKDRTKKKRKSSSGYHKKINSLNAYEFASLLLLFYSTKVCIFLHEGTQMHTHSHLGAIGRGVRGTRGRGTRRFIVHQRAVHPALHPSHEALRHACSGGHLTEGLGDHVRGVVHARRQPLRVVQSDMLLGGAGDLI